MTDRDRITSTPNLSSENTVSAGELLSSARISWDLTVEDVALNLNLGTDTINALEQNEYDRLPGHTFVRGYIRSYAKLLKLDEVAVLDAVELEETIPDTSIPRMNPRPYSRATVKKKKSGGAFFKILLGLIFLGVGGLYAASKLEKIDIQELAIMMKLPMLLDSDPVEDGDSEISFPVDADKNKPKEALIRIEE
ncbi:MAG: hypothetical protein GKR96_13815 [Gammaproteobacteria bacterium]|nr:hypothetical protein [Gammaproteobacteria bacterium]